MFLKKPKPGLGLLPYIISTAISQYSEAMTISQLKACVDNATLYDMTNNWCQYKFMDDFRRAIIYILHC